MAGTFPCSAIVNSIAFSIRLPQVNVLVCETYKVHKSKKTNAHKATQTDPPQGNLYFQTNCLYIQNKCQNLC